MRTPTLGFLLMAVAATPGQAGQKVFANIGSVAYKANGGKAIAAFPDVCLTPPLSAGSDLPVPYPNIGHSSDFSEGTKKTKAGGRIVVKTRAIRTGDGNAEIVHAFNLYDKAGKRVEIGKSTLIELEDGTLCGVCYDKGHITALLKLHKTPPELRKLKPALKPQPRRIAPPTLPPD